MSDDRFSDYVARDRERLSREREEISNQRRELDNRLAAIDREFQALDAYHAVKTGKPSGGRRTQTQGRARRGSRREELLHLIRDGNGLSRGVILERMGLKRRFSQLLLVKSSNLQPSVRLPMSGTSDKDTALDFRLLNLIATVIEACEYPRSGGRGHPPAATVRVLATLRRFLREGTPWRGLSATMDRASGSTLRRHLARWAETGLLATVHALLVSMMRGHPDLILDSCSVRAKRGGDLTGPNPTDRGKRGTKYHIATDGDGVPVACIATAANVNWTCPALAERHWLIRRHVFRTEPGW